WIEAVPRVFISDVFAKPVDVLGPNRMVQIRCSIDAGMILEKPAELRVEMKDNGRVVSASRVAINIEKPVVTDILLNLSDLGAVTLWDIDNPRLYDIETTLLVEGKPLHNHKTRIGLRDARFGTDGFYLNGKRLRIFGLNRHEIFPYAGFAMPDRVMRRDAEILKKEFNCNMVRCSHYPQTEAFLDACDELGLMVWEETPGWNYIGDASWKELVVRDVRDMIVRDRNHPSIIIWGTRVNESNNDVELYQKTRALAGSLDDSRPSSGTMTRHSTDGGWAEDVFSFDDYHADPGGGVGILGPIEGEPYLISEAVGQFNYQTGKGFNCYYRRDAAVDIQQVQALVHAQAHEKAAASARTCGVIAWCAFEYPSYLNSYKGIKNPGVADIFRISKLGASFYQAQRDIKKGAVIQPDFYWDFGPQCPSGPGKNAAIFSNCDRLELFINGTHHSTLNPDRQSYPNLKCPPFFADLEMSGRDFPELRIDGYVGDEMMLRRGFSSNPAWDQFLLIADDIELTGNGPDGTRVVFRVADKYGAPRPFAGGMVHFEIEGPGIIVGDNPFDLKESGGAAAIWVRTKPRSSGSIRVQATHSSMGSKTIRIASGWHR
ncbi:MAG TPA: glycoside hydrolase family 2 TIM barrel-domain containing protein, partial [Puia sp.]|nr:glycoside hydrolase family 2 TIM barrel-domain containing protein [Puia sp.]